MIVTIGSAYARLPASSLKRCVTSRSRVVPVLWHGFKSPSITTADVHPSFTDARSSVHLFFLP